MINKKSLAEVNQSKFFDSEFVKPNFDSYGFVNIPSFIEFCFDPKSTTKMPLDVFGNHKIFPRKKVVIFVIDSFGWNLLEKHSDHPLIKFFKKNAVISKIVSQFPSTTTAQLTTIHWGLPLSEHGLYEWFCYHHKVDEVICPILFSKAEDQKEETLEIEPEKIFPKKNFYQKLRQKNIASFVFQNKKFLNSTYNLMATKQAKVTGYLTLVEGLVNLRHSLENDPNTSYYFFYYELIDSLSHKYGPHSEQTKSEFLSFLYQFNEFFIPWFKKLIKKQNLLVIITADHGHVQIKPEETIYLNKLIPELDQFIIKNKKGNPITPVGSVRDYFLFVRDEYLLEIKEKLKKKLGDYALIIDGKSLFELKIFGDYRYQSMSKNLSYLKKSLVIIPYKNNSIWWYEAKYGFNLKFHGSHGGLTVDEMEIPFILL